MLEANRAALKGEFTVVTSSENDWNHFPMGDADPMAPRYVALVYDDGPIGLFFYWAGAFPVSPGLLVCEYHHRLIWTKAFDRTYQWMPELRIVGRNGKTRVLSVLDVWMGSKLRRLLRFETGPKRVRRWLLPGQATTQNLQRLVDEFVRTTCERNRPELNSREAD